MVASTSLILTWGFYIFLSVFPAIYLYIIKK
ncbi:putative membrane protein [Peptoniphilus sp. ING2-D1G]|nr:putative membrane protein [Peptoniphilus sp. ING2-D1G]